MGRHWSLLPAVAASAVLSWSGAVAHDLKGVTVERTTSSSPTLAAALARTATADFNTRSVLNNLQLWTVPRKLTVCFVSGTSELRKRITNSARKLWDLARLTEGRLDFDAVSFTQTPDCGINPTADIRIDFKDGDGRWSYVGLESRLHNPSMNFSEFATDPPDASEFDRIVGHEFGHALGLEHEHQSPGKQQKCNWDYAYIFKAYKWKNEKEMKDNIDPLVNYLENGRHAYVFDTYDKRSLMHYYFDARAYIDGTSDPCYITAQNQKPSAQDRNALAVAYGPQIVAEQVRTKSLVSEVAKAFPEPAYGKLQELLKLKATLLSE